MRTTIAIIRLVLRTNKVLSTGLHPIMIRCSYHGMKEISTGYSCSIKYWDKKNECIKKGFPSYIIINNELKKAKDKAISRRDRFIASGEVYTSSMVLDTSERFESVRNDLKWLISNYIETKGLAKRTIEKWWIVYRSLIHFASRDIIINEMNESFCRRYCKWLEDRGLTSGSIRSYMGKVVCILHYGVSLGILEKYPLSGWKYHLSYRECKSELYIHGRSMEYLMNMLVKRVIIFDGDLYRYNYEAIDELLDIHSSLYGLFIYCIGFYFKGLAPTDISMLKKSDIKIINIKDINYYAIDGKRSKTGMQYKIRLKQNCILSDALVKVMLMFNNSGEYFLPTLNGYNGNDIKKRINNVYSYHGEHLVDWFRVCNEEIIRHNVEKNDNVPLIDLDCRYYSYRHSYIMSEIQKPNVNLIKIATETGKSVTTLHQYISLLNDLDLV